MRGVLLSYGPSTLKKRFWNSEYTSGKWNFNDKTADDYVYTPLEKYGRNGSILDLGCGSGNTANEMAFNACRSYLGVDISESALEKARKWSERTGRAGKNTFATGDFLHYVPTQKFDVILFRESLYHCPVGKVKAVLDRYSKYLPESGVFIVRLFTTDNGKTKQRPAAMIHIMETEFDLIEKHQSGEKGATVLVFRPRTLSRELHGELEGQLQGSIHP
jgi:2-polyprenyl-3-methyl-5-hydroxy-6-metoxy-1,4-benzoquinol methylase